MKKPYTAMVAGAVATHIAYLVYLPSGGFLAMRWPRTFWLHVPTVCWGAAVVALELPCPLTSLEKWARDRAGMDPLPAAGFIGHYVDGVMLPANRIGAAQSFAFLAAAVSWIVLAVQRRARGGGRLGGR
ncbi:MULTISPECIES: DUF2784 domain-containing protein [Mycobacterium]|uniref:DUF2784 domain-containing protein n=1 Tax=Mycobacterium kiyosense TaxID=2871094 RepID=A0A9P3UU61_9MYCO|nr:MULTISPECIES: DUF2784 domain-containing protein [Mycobacterium]BDB41352.1 hypothetical protein IWGMT90018_17980 [Mycobacterium kiyosense]BDE13106.1 hypothetical protein MKCMC460_19660 [Mycobacterium sp. 20KCMC460]GLB82064.1 hypothetical protein SRL2020028_13200 [Mycobacterium kiyosense]GLB89575.1 hypothetical protein SRL2020130_23920 [Mycobacterium kiyosense]GLB95206.1 hypothetical protein SRL2020226_19820 [Mycobacterium kiyosense]